MEAKEVLESSRIFFWLLYDSSKLFEKLQAESWYLGPHKEWVYSLLIDKNKNVLEVGAGTAKLAKYVQDTYKCGVTAVDYSQKMLKRAEASGVKLVNADATQLPFPDENFDLVMSSSLVNIVSSPSKAIAEMLRVSRSGATVSFLVPSEKMTVENAKGYILANNLWGFSKSALLFWAKNAKIISKSEFEIILQKIGYQKSIKENYFFDDMLVSFTLEV